MYLLLGDVFKSFRNKYFEIYVLGPAHFLSTPRWTWQACLKKTEVELELLIDADVLLMIEKGIRGEKYHVVHRYAKANKKCMKDYDPSTELSNLMYWDANILYGWPMSQKLLVDGFKRN